MGGSAKVSIVAQERRQGREGREREGFHRGARRATDFAHDAAHGKDGSVEVFIVAQDVPLTLRTTRRRT